MNTKTAENNLCVTSDLIKWTTQRDTKICLVVKIRKSELRFIEYIIFARNSHLDDFYN
jgi:hypothetical protein